MNIHEKIDAFLSGERPEQIPYTIYDCEWQGVKDCKEWDAMFAEGLGVTWHLPTFSMEYKNVESELTRYSENSLQLERMIYRTPVGDIFQESNEGWVRKYFLESPDDYRVMTYIVENTKIIPAYDEFLKREKEILPNGIPLITGGRTPFQTILVDMVGLENFSYHIFDFEDEVNILYEALLKQYRKIAEIITEGPGKYISMDENFTAETLGPSRFAKFHIPVYKEIYPLFHTAGKIVCNHYDGKLKSCKDLVAEAPIDVIESLTPPPEGDMTLEECRKAWPDKNFWVNIRVSDYNLPEKELYDLVLNLVQQASHDGKRLAFEVSEHLPVNWRDSMPVVLKALRETRI